MDLIVRRGSTVAFCEVKVRSTARFGTGAEAVPAPSSAGSGAWPPVAGRARSGLSSARAAPARSASTRERVELRFDVVSVTAGRVEVIQDAF